MPKYLVTFPNVFETAKFKDDPEMYFSKFYIVKIKHYSRTFCEITTQSNSQYQFYYFLLLERVPGVKILLKQQRNNKTKYITL